MLVDLGFIGLVFTWNNHWPGVQNVQKRIDRAVVNVDLQLLFPSSKVNHMEFFGSDHRALLWILERERYALNWRIRRERGFRFKPLWVEDEECRKVV